MDSFKGCFNLHTCKYIYDELQSFQHISVTSWKWVEFITQKTRDLEIFVLFETKAAINAIDCSPKHYISEVCFTIIIAFYFFKAKGIF